MRTSKEFFENYQQALVEPSQFNRRRKEDQNVALADLCLHFLHTRLPKESVEAVPFLLMGYPQMLGDLTHTNALMALRHLAYSLSSLSAWYSARDDHQRFPEILRAYIIQAKKPNQRRAASDRLLDILESALITPTPYAQRNLLLAQPGPGYVHLDHNRIRLQYMIPSVNDTRSIMPSYQRISRSYNPPIVISWEQLLKVATEVDNKEADPSWKATNLAPLNLEKRLKNVQIESSNSVFFHDEQLFIEKTAHVVGMLSSGKSTLVLALLFALTRPGYNKRILVLVPDTTAGAMMSVRLRSHGIKSTVLSSFFNRAEHLNAIHWHHGMTGGGWSMEKIGDLVHDFGIACPLDGYQKSLNETNPYMTDGAKPRFPRLGEKVCHHITQPNLREEETDDYFDLFAPNDTGRSCPLFALCPAQSQQREAVTAQVTFMTPAAFIHMTPDKNLSRESLSLPELIQYTHDLVIIDEADSVQQHFDKQFAIKETIMGGDDETYLLDVTSAVSQALRQRSGGQYRSRTNLAWQLRMNRLSNMVGLLYSLLQNEGDELRTEFFHHQQFTAASILCHLWKWHYELEYGKQDAFSITGPVEKEFIHVLNLARALSRLTIGAEFDEENFDEDNEALDALERLDERFRNMAERLIRFSQQLLLTNLYIETAREIESLLDNELILFNATLPSKNSKQQTLTPRQNALAIVMALLAELILSNFNYLVQNQAQVARAFNLEHSNIFQRVRHLLRHYQTLIPRNPAGNVFGLQYEEPSPEQRHEEGGKLSLINHLGVGRYLLYHLHDLLIPENQAGPHVLLLSGTSWAGGNLQMNVQQPVGSNTINIPVDIASPNFDVQVEVAGVLQQPKSELEQLKRSFFELIPMRPPEKQPISVSGQKLEKRRANLAFIGKELVRDRSGENLLQRYWSYLAKKWEEKYMQDRQRALLVVNSYDDAAIVANAIQEVIKAGRDQHQVYALIRDEKAQADKKSLPASGTQVNLLPGVFKLPRSLVEEFGKKPEGSILVAPIQVISRGHNILNGKRTDGEGEVAAISTIFFLHRPHPRPEDLSPVIGQLNRFAMNCVEGHGLDKNKPNIFLRGRQQRYQASGLVRRALGSRQKYYLMPDEQKAQFAWDLVTLLWQTIGRGIRGGVPVFVGFIDARFAPESFKEKQDTPYTSCLVQCIQQLERALSPEHNPAQYKIARKLYEPFYEKLRETKKLNITMNS